MLTPDEYEFFETRVRGERLHKTVSEAVTFSVRQIVHCGDYLTGFKNGQADEARRRLRLERESIVVELEAMKAMYGEDK